MKELKSTTGKRKPETRKRVNTKVNSYKGKDWKYIRRSDSKIKSIKSVLDVAKLYAKGFKLVPNVTVSLDTDDVNLFREFDRNTLNGNSATRTKEQITKVKESLVKKGFIYSGHISFFIDKGKILAYLGEGNHRLKLAKELGIKKYPVHFVYLD